jgi:uncharacterized protein (DUF58 family)
MSGRTLLLAFLAFGLLIIGLGAINGAVIALALPLCLYLAAAVFFNPGMPRISAERTLSTEGIFPNTPVNIRLSVRNEGSTVEEMDIKDIIPEGLEILEGETEAFITLAAGEEAVLEYTVKGGRGDYRFNSVKVTVREAFGLFETSLVVQAAHRLIVRPRPVRLKPMRIRPPQTRGFAGPIPSRQGGNGTDFFVVREYQPGDPIKRINWKIAAHGGNELYTNVYEQERVADIGIILDAREQSYGDLPNHPLFERAVQAAASLAEGFLMDGNRVGVLVYGGGIESAFPGTGKVQRQRILQVLARARTGRNFALESLRYLPTRFFPPHSQVLLVSPLVQADIEILLGLRAFGYAVLVVSPDIIHYDAGEVEPDTRSSMALRLALAERALMLQRIRRAGVQVIDWNTDTPIENITRRHSVLRLAANRSAEMPS